MSEQAKRANKASTKEDEQVEATQNARSVKEAIGLGMAEKVGETEAGKHVAVVAKTANSEDLAEVGQDAEELQAQDRVVRLLSKRDRHDEIAEEGASSDSMVQPMGGMTWRHRMTSDRRDLGASGNDVNGNRKFKLFKFKLFKKR